MQKQDIEEIIKKILIDHTKDKKMEQLQIFDKDGKVLHMADVMAMLLPNIEEFDTEAEQFAEGGFSTKDEKYAYTAAWQDCRTWLIELYKSKLQ